MIGAIIVGLLMLASSEAASNLLTVDVDCPFGPFQLQPTNVNISEGSNATFEVITCKNESVLWHITDVGIFYPGYDLGGISVHETILTNGSRLSVITIVTNGTRYNGKAISATVSTSTGQRVRSNYAILNIQGLLGPVTNVSYNTTSNILSWSPPPTLDGVPIHYYIITITSNTSHPPSLTATTNIISLDGVDFTSCEDYIISIYPVNSVGNGTAMTLPYKHVGVPMVMIDNVDVLVNDSIISFIIDYKIQYDCSDQFPDIVYATIREGNGLNYMSHRDNITSTSHNDGAYNGRYVITGLSDNSNFTVQLVFIIKSGLTVKTDMFTFDTWYDVTSHITTTTIDIFISSSSNDVTSAVSSIPVTSTPTVTDPAGTTIGIGITIAVILVILVVILVLSLLIVYFKRRGNRNNVAIDDVPIDDVPINDVPIDDVPIDDVPIDDVPINDVPIDDVPVLRGVRRLSQDGAAAQDADNNDKSDPSTGQPEELVCPTPANKTYEMVEYPTNPTVSTYINPDDYMSPWKQTPDTYGVVLVPAPPTLPPGMGRVRSSSTQVSLYEDILLLSSLPTAIDPVVYSDLSYSHINVSTEPKVVVHGGGRTEEGDDNDDDDDDPLAYALQSREAIMDHNKDYLSSVIIMNSSLPPKGHPIDNGGGDTSHVATKQGGDYC